MWKPIREFFAKSGAIGSLLGEILYETEPLQGQVSTSLFQWRVKKGLDDASYFVGVKMLPDGYAGAEGSPNNYINFDLETAERIRAGLEACIAECRRLEALTNK
ncbi:hypothetical protein AB4Y85_12820 [Microvirga sp. 2YAF29]|uniref:hypothetical protein n=1 Tax=Microvirga sp. 2YAF29 TaxID=3233031 RepID=UPI003F98D4A1